MNNLDKHPTRKSCYIAYDAQGFAFRVEKGIRRWHAYPSHAAQATDERRFTAERLRDCAAKVGKSSRVELEPDDSGLRNFAV